MLETLTQDRRNGGDGKKIGWNCNFNYQAPGVQKLDLIVSTMPDNSLCSS